MQCTEVPLKKTLGDVNLPERDILANLPCGLVVLNAQGYILWLNAAAEELLGTGLQGLAWRKVIRTAFSPREDDGHEVSLTDGRRVHVALSSLNSLPGQLVILTDLTVTRAYEQARAHKGRLAAIGRMTAQLAHQIRTPLSSAILYTEHLANVSFVDQRYAQWIAKLQGCHSSIEKQIRDLLLFAKGESLESVPTSMHDWCEQLLERAQPLVQAESAKFMVENQLNDTVISLHRESLIGAVLNLIINALQAQANCISLIVKENEQGGLQLKIVDNGIGMSNEVKAQAFSPFFTTKAQGTGLGLAVVYAVVEAHGGEVFLDSSPGKGSCITINLPG
ncbi:ATP-binding protein [Legionella sp.]|uniref:sensor histidine kinase n=1 Tax=Legionella sp. TaxID=459 RepID=UPI0032205CCD